MPPFSKGQIAEIRQEAHDVFSDRIDRHEDGCKVRQELAVYKAKTEGRLRLICLVMIVLATLGSTAGGFLARLLGL